MYPKKSQLGKPWDQFHGKGAFVKMLSNDGHTFLIHKYADTVSNLFLFTLEQIVYPVEINNIVCGHEVSP
jgi:hypothetical protein